MFGGLLILSTLPFRRTLECEGRRGVAFKCNCAQVQRESPCEHLFLDLTRAELYCSTCSPTNLWTLCTPDSSYRSSSSPLPFVFNVGMSHLFLLKLVTTPRLLVLPVSCVGGGRKLQTAKPWGQNCDPELTIITEQHSLSRELLGFSRHRSFSLPLSFFCLL